MHDEYHKRNPFAMVASCPKCGFISNWDLQYKASRSNEKLFRCTVNDKRLVGILNAAEREKYRDYFACVYTNNHWIDVTCPVCGNIFHSPIAEEFNDVLLVPNSYDYDGWPLTKLWVDAEAIRADKNYRLKVYKPGNTATTVIANMVAANVVAKEEPSSVILVRGDYLELSSLTNNQI